MNNSVLYKQENNIAEITLNRPDDLNAMNLDLMRGLADAFQKAKDPSVRVVVLKGEGRAFCAGGDVKYFKSLIDHKEVLSEELPEVLHEAIESIRNLEKPVLALVQGHAAGAGAPLALACDLIMAREDAVISFAYARIAMSPDGSSTFYLPRHLGLKKATELFMLCPTLKAKEAYDLGLVNWVVPKEKFREEAAKITTQLAKGPTKSFAHTKKLLNATFTNSLKEQLDLEKDLIVKATQTKDFKEGVTAFLDKRQPQFSGE